MTLRGPKYKTAERILTTQQVNI